MKNTQKKGTTGMISTAEQQKVVPQQRGTQQNSRTGRLLRFLFSPPRLGPVPPTWVATELAGVKVYNRFAARLAKSPPDLVTHLGMVRSNAYYDAGCPLELCDHAAARDLWRVIHHDAISFEPVVTPHAIRQMEGLCH
jgi:hypothetical protein